jgi:hypothetical protein
MSEEEWLACTNPMGMLAFLRGMFSDRKLRLFAVACCGIGWHLIADDQNRRAIEIAESLADGTTYREQLPAVRASLTSVTAWCTIEDSAWVAATRAALSGVRDAARSAARNKAWSGREERDAAWWQARAATRFTQASIVRDIFGTPFRSIALAPTSLAWHGGLIVSMARQMYDSRDFREIPVLADALEEAGCMDADILNHCRQPGEHVRGCWVIDTLLGKS